MIREEGPWGDREPLYEADERELADLPSSAALWILIALGVWIASGVTAALIWLR